MHHYFRPTMVLCQEIVQSSVKYKLGAMPQNQSLHSHQWFALRTLSSMVKWHAPRRGCHSMSNNNDPELLQLPNNLGEAFIPIDKIAVRVENLLRELSCSSNEEYVQSLNNCELPLNEDLVLDVLRRHHSDWKTAFRFFNWVSGVTDLSPYMPGSVAYNEMLGILGKAKQFEELGRVFDVMFDRGVMNERSYAIVVHRYAAAHKIDDAIDFFYERRQYGLELDLVAFQTLLLSLCRYKHVEAAENLLHSKKCEFQYDTKTWNIILNGWSVLGNLSETKRFWNEIIRSESKPDKFTYGIFINSLCKSGKISSAVKLFRAMWKKGYTPDVVICNSVIDGLCFKKRIPEALEIFREMNDNGCQPNIVTYNCLIKHLCKIRRIEVAFQLLGEMEEKGGDCSPNSRTYSHLLAVAKEPNEVSSLLESMKIKQCKITSDTYNLVLRLYMNWDCEEHVQLTWAEMLRDGVGPDQRSYTVMIHRLYHQGRSEDALKYFKEMTSKGMIPEPRTKLLVNAMETKLEEKESQQASKRELSKHRRKRHKANF